MNKARLIITALRTENLTQQEAADRYGVSQSWVSKLVTRFRDEGEAAFDLKSRRPHKNTKVIMLIDGLEIRVVDQKTGELIRELTLDPARDYQRQE